MSRDENNEPNAQPTRKKFPGWVYIASIITISLILIGTLGVIAFLGEPDEVRLAELGDWVGDEVVCEGIVLDINARDISSSMLLYEFPSVVKVDVEGVVKAEINDRVRVRGEVYSYGDSFSLSVAGTSGVSVIGEATVDRISPANLSDFESRYVKLEGVVSGVSVDNWGGNWADIIPLPEEGVGTSTAKIKLPDGIELNTTDKIEVFGVVRTDPDPYLYVYCDESLAIQRNYWTPRSYSLGMVAEMVDKDPLELELFPFNVTGYLKYEPGSYPSITLTDKVEDGIYSFSVDVSLANSTEVHKGDLVEVSGLLFFDPATLKFKILAQDVQLLEEYGIWNVTLELLAKDYYLFENAYVKVNGSVVYDGDAYLESGVVRIPIISENISFLDDVFTGWLRFDRDGLFYYLELE